MSRKRRGETGLNDSRLNGSTCDKENSLLSKGNIVRVKLKDFM